MNMKKVPGMWRRGPGLASLGVGCCMGSSVVREGQWAGCGGLGHGEPWPRFWGNRTLSEGIPSGVYAGEGLDQICIQKDYAKGHNKVKAAAIV